MGMIVYIRYFLTRIVVFFCVLLGPLLEAQPEARSIQFRAICFDVMPEGLLFENAGKLQSLEIGGSNRGPEINYTGTPLIHFFRLRVNESGEDIRVSAGRVEIAPGVNECLLFFFPRGESSGTARWDIFATDDSHLAFGPGDIRFVNLAGQAIAGVLDDRTMRLPPGAVETISPDKSEAGGIGIKLAAYLDEGWEPFFSSRWPYRENVRLIVLFVPDRKNGGVRMRAIPEYIRARAS